jgi:hypothetical protein
MKKKIKANKNVLVVYLNVGNLNNKDVPQFVEKAKKGLGPIPDSCYRFIVPVRSETRVEVLHLV